MHRGSIPAASLPHLRVLQDAVALRARRFRHLRSRYRGAQRAVPADGRNRRSRMPHDDEGCRTASFCARAPRCTEAPARTGRDGAARRGRGAVGLTLPVEGEEVSVVWGSGSRMEVKRAKIVVAWDSTKYRTSIGALALLIHYRLHYDPPRSTTYNDGVELLTTEGLRWCRGWTGPQVDALKTVVALSEDAA